MTTPSKKVLMYEWGGLVTPNQLVTLQEGLATIKEILDNFRVLVQFEDPKIRPNWRELDPEVISAVLVEPPTKQPPIGLRPRNIWVATRIAEIREAIQRYESENVAVPRAWRAELSALGGSLFEPVDTQKQLDDFAQHVQYHPAYSVEDLQSMVSNIRPYLATLHGYDFQIKNGKLISQHFNGDEEIVVDSFSYPHKNYQYLIAFLLNNAVNLVRMK